jgi:protein TonB
MVRGPGARAAGWALAGTLASALLYGVAAMALASERQAQVVILDLGALPPAALSVAAVAEAAPELVDAAPLAPTEPDLPEEVPEVPQGGEAPRLTAASQVTLPVPETPVSADLAVPPPEKEPEPKAEEPKPKPKSKSRSKPAPDRKAEPEKPTETNAETASAAPATAPSIETKAKKGGAMSPAAYAKTVMKKVRATKKRTGAGKGMAVVGFSIAADGSLAGITLVQGSGNAALDKVALDHIRRSAPFPSPPEGAGRNYSFEFIGK